MKQRVPLMGLEPTTSTLRVGRATHCATPSQFITGKRTCNDNLYIYLKKIYNYEQKQ